MDPVALTRHFIVESDSPRPLARYLTSQGFGHEQIETLLHFGAVYLNRKRITEAADLAPGDYLRVHPTPKRYATQHIDWNACVVTEDPDFLIVNKPTGMPVHASLDNRLENVVRCLESTRQEKLYVTQRLDVATSGLVFLGRTPRAQTLFNRYLRERTISKTYLALCANPPPLGHLVHFMEPRDCAPHVVSKDEKPNWRRCELVVDAVRARDSVWEVELRLLTGRTHQVRVQLAEIGCALLGDSVYGGVAYSRLGLHCSKLAFKWKGVERSFLTPPDWES